MKIGMSVIHVREQYISTESDISKTFHFHSELTGQQIHREMDGWYHSLIGRAI